MAAATAVSYINPPADKKQLGQKREREERERERERRESGGDGKKVRGREGVMVGHRDRRTERESKTDGDATEIPTREKAEEETRKARVRQRARGDEQSESERCSK